jgi:hypothetical protein
MGSVVTLALEKHMCEIYHIYIYIYIYIMLLGLDLMTLYQNVDMPRNVLIR